MERESHISAWINPTGQASLRISNPLVARGKGEELTHLVSHHTGLSREPLSNPSGITLEVQIRNTRSISTPQFELHHLSSSNCVLTKKKTPREMAAGYIRELDSAESRELDSAQSFLSSKSLISVTERAGVLKRFQRGKHKNGWRAGAAQ